MSVISHEQHNIYCPTKYHKYQIQTLVIIRILSVMPSNLLIIVQGESNHPYQMAPLGERGLFWKRLSYKGRSCDTAF